MTELDDFISRVSTMSKSELIEEKARLDLAIARIQTQLDKPHNPHDQEWRTNARIALRFKQVERDYVTNRLTISNGDLFQQKARELLDPDTFNIIMEQANA